MIRHRNRLNGISNINRNSENLFRFEALEQRLLLAFSAPEVKPWGNLPVEFVPNYGQFEEPTQYTANSAKQQIAFSSRGVRFTPRIDSAHVVELGFHNSNVNPRLEPLSRLPGTYHYYVGNDASNWKTNIPTYRGIRYLDLYDGIDLIYSSQAGQLKSEFHVVPGANASQIRLDYRGNAGLEIADDGSLLINNGAGHLIEQAPEVFQWIDGQRVDVAAAYSLDDDQNVRFQLAPFDPNHTLIIDPVMGFSAFLGGNAFETTRETDTNIAVDVDLFGNTYVAGTTNSPDFVATDGSVNTGDGVFLTSINPRGTSRRFTAIIGGSGFDRVTDLVLDEDGNSYLVGATRSLNFPVSATAHDQQCGAEVPVDGQPGETRVVGCTSGDAFVASLSPNGSALRFATFYGGVGSDVATGVDIDTDGNVYVTGTTDSEEDSSTGEREGIPVIAASQNNLRGGSDGFVAKFNQDGSSLDYSTYIGGAADDQLNGIAVDTDGKALVAGSTDSTNFPISGNPFQTDQGGRDAVVAKLGVRGNREFSTYLGGEGNDEGLAIDVHPDGTPFIAGSTNSEEFPVLSALQRRFVGGTTDAFVTQLTEFGDDILFSTFMGSTGREAAQSIQVDVRGRVHVTGYTTGRGFSNQESRIREISDNPGLSVFTSKIHPTVDKPGSRASVHSNLIGGSSGDGGADIAVDELGNIYVVGVTSSEDFPVTEGSFDIERGGSRDYFVLKLRDLVVNSDGDDDDRDPDDDRCDTGNFINGLPECTLRAAMQQAEASPNLFDYPDFITFEIEGDAPHVISIGSPLPVIEEEALIIDGTQEGFGPDGIKVEIRGQGLHLRSSGNRLDALAIYSTAGPGIVLEGKAEQDDEGNVGQTGGSRVQNIHIGLNAEGNAARGVAGPGIHIKDSPRNVIRNVVVADSSAEGVLIEGPEAVVNQFADSFVGTDATGRLGFGNAGSGVVLSSAAENFIVGNIIAANRGHGVEIKGNNAKQNSIDSNLLGVNFDIEPLGNENGILIDGEGSSGVEHNVLIDNTISGNRRHGVEISGAGSVRSELRSNKIGTDASGFRAVPNQENGVLISNAEHTYIGGGGAAFAFRCLNDCNVISGNNKNGIEISGSNAIFTEVGQNHIGLNFDSSDVIPNGQNGILVSDGAHQNLFEKNRIAGNTGLGIDLNGDGVSANDLAGDEGELPDRDEGPNALQNYPVLFDASSTKVTGQLHSTPNTTFRIEVFGSDEADPGGFGEGQRFLGESDVTTDEDGFVSFEVAFFNSDFLEPIRIPNGTVLTATASRYEALEDGADETAQDPYDTSEFSEAILPIIVNSVAAHPDDDEEDGICATGNVIFRENDFGEVSVEPECTLLAAIQEANNQFGKFISFDIAGIREGERFTINSPTEMAYPNLEGQVVIDGTTQPGFEESPLIELDGITNNLDGLTLHGENNEIHGLAFRRFRTAITIEDAQQSTISRNVIGEGIRKATDDKDNEQNGLHIKASEETIVAANLISGNNQHGILVENSKKTTIGGESEDDRNIIAGNDVSGVAVRGAESEELIIQNNFIGIESDGETANPNVDGISIQDAPNVRIIDNVISSNLVVGIEVIGRDLSPSEMSGIVIAGNLIGTNKDGTCTLDNMNVCPSGNGSGIFLLDVANVLIGDPEEAPSNVISGSKGNAISIFARREDQNLAINNRVIGNFIGTDAEGRRPIPNADGIEVLVANGNIIGQAGAGNVIAASKGVAVNILGASDTTIHSNAIGVNVDSTCGVIEDDMTCPFGNGHGVVISQSGQFVPNETLIGGTLEEERNLIAFSEHAGVLVSAGTGHQVLGNAFFGNREIQLDLSLTDAETDGQTSNDPLDADDGPNGLQNHPIIKSIADDQLQGELRAKPNTIYRLEFFAFAPDDGQFLGAIDDPNRTTSDNEGVLEFDFGLPELDLGNNVCVSVAATDPDGNTSELAPCGPLLLPSSPGFLSANISRNQGHNIPVFSVFPAIGFGSNCQTATTYLVVDGDTSNPLVMSPFHTAEDDACHSMVNLPVAANRNTSLELQLRWALGKDVPFADTLTSDSFTLESIDNAELMVLTDFSALFAEMTEIATGQGFSRPGNADVNNNGVLDFYEAVNRIVEYADNNEGFVLDVRQNAYSDGEADYHESFEVREQMTKDLDLLATRMPASIQDIAVIGNDAVVPYYRVPVTDSGLLIADESGFASAFRSVGSVSDIQNKSNSTFGHWLSDIPYATRDNSLPRRPIPDVGIGRAFRDRPNDLVQYIDAAETPIELTASESRIWVFNDPADEIRFTKRTEAIVLPKIAQLYNGSRENFAQISTRPAAEPPGTIYRQGQTIWVNGDNRLNTEVDRGFKKGSYAWDKRDVNVAKTQSDMLVFETHGSENGFWGAGGAKVGRDALQGGNYRFVISTACHTGLVTSYRGHEPNRWDRQWVAHGTLDSNAAFFAPTGYSFFQEPVVDIPLIFVLNHGWIRQRFLENMFSQPESELGDLMRTSRHGYPCVVCLGSDTNALYTYQLVGLPTQKVIVTKSIEEQQQAVAVQQIENDNMPLAATSLEIERSVRIPTFETVEDEEGRTAFTIPNNGTLGGPAGAPALPLIVHSYALPADAEDIRVELVSSDSRAHDEPVELITSPLHALSFGVIEGTLELTDPYPSSPINFRVYPDEGGFRLDVEITPIQYDPTSRAVTLFDRVDYRINYEGPDDQLIQEIVVNQGATVPQNEPAQIGIDVTSVNEFSGSVRWRIVGVDGQLIESDFNTIDLAAGQSRIEFDTSNTNWLPGPKQVLFSLVDDSGEDATVVATGHQIFIVAGETIQLSLNEEIFSAGSDQARIELSIHDERGERMLGQSGNLRQQLDGTAINLNWAAATAYSTTLELAGIEEGQHQLTVSLPSGVSTSINFSIDRQPPVSTLFAPEISYNNSVELRVEGSDGLGNVDHYQVEFRFVGESDWQPWITLPGDWDFTQTGLDDLTPTFSDSDDEALQPGAQVEFRVHAVDVAGNEEPLHPQADAATQICRIDQISNAENGDSHSPRTSGDGATIAYLSSQNLDGGNVDGNVELFLFNRQQHTTVQITDTVGASHETVAIDPTGRRIVFHSQHDFVGNNADGNNEIFLFDIQAGLIRQLTETEGGENYDAQIAEDGSIVFLSNRNLVGTNADGNHEIYLIDQAGRLTQVTDTVDGNINSVRVSADGNTVVFSDTGNPTFENFDANREIFHWDRRTGNLMQITSTFDSANHSPTVNSEGTRVAFVSSANLTGLNTEHDEEIFLFDVNDGISQLTDNGTPDISPSIDASGFKVVFVFQATVSDSDRDLGSIGLIDLNRHISSVVGEFASNARSVDISHDGMTLAFDSTSNISGQNADGNFEIYATNCDPTIPGDLDNDGGLSIRDIDLLCQEIRDESSEFDLNGDNNLDQEDIRFLVEDLMRTHIGDANLDGVFNSSDFVLVFQTGEYEDDVAQNSTWADGDWNCDGEFDSGDLVFAFQTGGFSPN